MAAIYRRKKAKRDKDRDAKNRYILYWAKRIYIYNMLGGECIRCENKRSSVLALHHHDGKEESINELFGRKARIEDIIAEAQKCQLLCENCHREVHEELTTPIPRTRQNKEIVLQIKGGACCTQCGYNKSLNALDFHHPDPAKKEFGIAKAVTRYTWKTVGDLEDYIVEEIEKCEVLCANCHRDHHFDWERFECCRLEIEAKSKCLKSKNKVKQDEVIALHQEGKSVKEVATQLCCSIGRAYEILQAHGLNSAPHRVDRARILELHRQGLSSRQIHKETGYSCKIILRHIKEGTNENHNRPDKYDS